MSHNRFNTVQSFYEITNAPLSPVSLTEAKDFLRIDASVTKEDSLITALIAAAVDWGERFTGIDFSEKEYTGLFSNLISSNMESYPYLEISRSPITAINTVETSQGGVFSSFTDFIRKQNIAYDRILFKDFVSIDNDVAYTFRVTFNAGHDASNFPDGLKTAILEHVSFLYENRADAPSDPPNQIKMLYRIYRHIPGYA